MKSAFLYFRRLFRLSHSVTIDETSGSVSVDASLNKCELTFQPYLVHPTTKAKVVLSEVFLKYQMVSIGTVNKTGGFLSFYNLSDYTPSSRTESLVLPSGVSYNRTTTSVKTAAST